MRMVLDTNVIVSALLWNGAPKQLFQLSQAEGVLLITSTPLLDELAETLSKTKLERKIVESLLSIDQLIHLYAGLVSVVRPISVPRLAPDPDDDVVIGTALAAKANLIVTGDRTLLSVAECEGVRIVSVGEALELISQTASH